MTWFNYLGLLIFAGIMAPNIIFAIRHKEGFENKIQSKVIIILEQIGRYGSMIFMIFSIPYVSKGFWFENCRIIYLAVNIALAAFYCTIWAVYWNKNSMSKVLMLSILPSCIFLFSGAITSNIPLIITGILFSVGHVTISVKNYQENRVGRQLSK